MLNQYYQRLEDISQDCSKRGWENLKELFNDIREVKTEGIEDLRYRIEEEFTKKKREFSRINQEREKQKKSFERELSQLEAQNPDEETLSNALNLERFLEKNKIFERQTKEYKSRVKRIIRERSKNYYPEFLSSLQERSTSDIRLETTERPDRLL